MAASLWRSRASLWAGERSLSAISGSAALLTAFHSASPSTPSDASTAAVGCERRLRLATRGAG